MPTKNDSLLTSILLLSLVLFTVFIAVSSADEVYCDTLYPIRIKDQWGYMNNQGEVILPCQWRECGEFRGAGYALVCDWDGTYGIIDKSGTYRIKGKYLIDDGAELGYYGGIDTGVFWVIEDEKCGFFDVETGYFSGLQFDPQTDPWFDGACSSFIRATFDGSTYGYVNRHSGEIMISPTYNQSNTVGFHNGFAVEYTEEMDAILIGEDGATVALPLDLKIADGALVEDGLILIQNKETMLFGYCDTNGQCVIQPVYEEASSFSEGYASVKIEYYWGHIDKTGALISSAVFDTKYQFYSRLAVTQKDNVPVIINTEGAVVHSFPKGIQLFPEDSHGLVLFTEGSSTGLWGGYGEILLDLDANVTIDCYQPGPYFPESRQRAQDITGKWGFVDLDGQICEPFQWDSVGQFHHGLARVESDGVMVYIDHAGNIISPAVTFEE